MTNTAAQAANDDGGQFPAEYFPDLAEYLSARVAVTPGGCWEWQRSTSGGYGQIGSHTLARQHGTARVHRLAFLCANSRLPSAPLVIRHKCDNRRCCNPSHLEEGTPQENVRDMWERGRSNVRPPRLIGEAHGYAKLTVEAVRFIRASREPNHVLGSQFGVTTACIHAVRKGITWRHVSAPVHPSRRTKRVARSGGARPGERHHKAKLTETAVREIRASNETRSALARHYGVSPATISNICQRVTWRHL